MMLRYKKHKITVHSLVQQIYFVTTAYSILTSVSVHSIKNLIVSVRKVVAKLFTS